jgi:hypothetical protein
MTNLNVPAWCRTLIERSNEAYIFITNNKIAFLNEKAEVFFATLFPDTYSFIGSEALWENEKLIIKAIQYAGRLAVFSNNSSLDSEHNEQIIKILDKNYVELLFADETIQLFKIKNDLTNTDIFSESEKCY